MIPKELSVSDIDLCVVIGNLIDNAVEACRTVKKEEQFLRLYIAPLKQQLYITVTNATSEVVRKLDEEYISKKRGDHGHGLKRINNVVKKYDGISIERMNQGCSSPRSCCHYRENLQFMHGFLQFVHVFYFENKCDKLRMQEKRGGFIDGGREETKAKEKEHFK